MALLGTTEKSIKLHYIILHRENREFGMLRLNSASPTSQVYNSQHVLHFKNVQSTTSVNQFPNVFFPVILLCQFYKQFFSNTFAAFMRYKCFKRNLHSILASDCISIVWIV